MEILEQVVAIGKVSFDLLRDSFFNLLQAPLNPGQHIFWMYLLSSLAAALMIYVYFLHKQRRLGGDGRMGVRDFFRFCFPASIWSHPSSKLDMRYVALHLTVQGAIVPLFRFGYIAAIALTTQSWIMGRYGTPPLWAYRKSVLAALFSTLFLFLLTDFLGYLMHRLQHKVPFLWEFHKVHHSAAVLNPLSNYREHPVDNIFYGWSLGLANGIGIGLLLCIFEEYRFLEVMGVTFVAMMFSGGAYHLRHSHIWLAWPPALGRILGSPANHQIHHSAEDRHIDKNFGFVFALWDWIFGTLYLPREREEFRIGLSDGTGAQYNSILRLYFLPFAKIFQSVVGLFRRAPD